MKAIVITLIWLPIAMYALWVASPLFNAIFNDDDEPDFLEDNFHEISSLPTSTYFERVYYYATYNLYEFNKMRYRRMLERTSQEEMVRFIRDNVRSDRARLQALEEYFGYGGHGGNDESDASKNGVDVRS